MSGADSFDLAMLGARLIFAIGALLASGLVLHRALDIGDPSPRLRRVLRWALVAAFLGLLAKPIFQAAELGGTWPSALDPVLLRLAASASLLPTSATLAGLLIMAFGSGIGSRALKLAAVVFVLSGFALTGHPAALEPWPLGSALITVHMFFAAFWIAAPVTLWPGTDTPNNALVRSLERFSRIALIAVPLLFVAGTALALYLAEGWRGLTGTNYGRLLFAKLSLASIGLGLGAANKVWLTPAIRNNTPSAKKHLKWTLSGEAILFALILIAASSATTIMAPHSQD